MGHDVRKHVFVVGQQYRGRPDFTTEWIGLDPASTVIWNIRHTPNKSIWNFSNPQKIFSFCILTLRKDPKMHRNGPQNSPVLWIYPQNLHSPKIFPLQKKNKEYRNIKFWTTKNGPSLRILWKYQSTPIHLIFCYSLSGKYNNVIPHAFTSKKFQPVSVTEVITILDDKLSSARRAFSLYAAWNGRMFMIVINKLNLSLNKIQGVY